MTNQAKCEGCSETFGVANLRYSRVGGEYKYLCTSCRKVLKSGGTLPPPPAAPAAE